MLTEKIELLGKGVYTNGTPDVLTLKSIPTASELDYVGSEDFDQTMIQKILPKSVEEDVDFNEILAIDYFWICRCLRLLNYGPYHTTNAIFCPDCRQTHYESYQVDLRNIECKPLPDNFNNKIVISRDEFMDFDKDITISLLTISEHLNLEKDALFQDEEGHVNTSLARLCYEIKEIDGDKVTPIEVKRILSQMSPADYLVLKNLSYELTNYGLASGGYTICPKCKSTRGAFMALVNDKFFRPTLGDIRQWRSDTKNK